MSQARLAERTAYTYLPASVRDRVDLEAARLGLSRAAWLRMVVLDALRALDGREVDA